MRPHYKPSEMMFSDITGFISIVQSIIESYQKATRRRLIQALKSDKDLISVYINQCRLVSDIS
jgi:hypothetical protein